MKVADQARIRRSPYHPRKKILQLDADTISASKCPLKTRGNFGELRKMKKGNGNILSILRVVPFFFERSVRLLLLKEYVACIFLYSRGQPFVIS